VRAKGLAVPPHFAANDGHRSLVMSPLLKGVTPVTAPAQGNDRQPAQRSKDEFPAT
jgi:hypothetical protein